MYEEYQKPGCYCITIENRIVYIGKTTDMYRRFTEHRRLIYSTTSEKQWWIYKILRKAKFERRLSVQMFPLYWSQEQNKVAIKADITAHEALFIKKYQPCLNLEIPNYDGTRNCLTTGPFRVTLDQIMALPQSKFTIAELKENQQ